MRALLFIILSLLFFGCSSFQNPNKISTSEKMNTYGLGKEYSFNISKDWFLFDWHGNLNSAPKSLQNTGINLLNNNLYIFESTSHENFKSLKETVSTYLENSKKHYAKALADIKEINEHHYIVTTIKKLKTGADYKELIHFRENDGKVYIIRYKMTSDLFNIHLNDARVIFNSFKFID
jgi:hypothetical protein